MTPDSLHSKTQSAGNIMEHLAVDGSLTHARPLAGVRICLVDEGDLAHRHRILQEIDALQEAGAEVVWLTAYGNPESAPQGVRCIVTSLFAPAQLPASNTRLRAFRVASNLIRNKLRPLITEITSDRVSPARHEALRELAPRTDVFWVIDYPSLPGTMRMAKISGCRVVYETMDLVPEYGHIGHLQRIKSRAGEKRLVGLVDGFITACESYADYYVERYRVDRLGRLPAVCYNVPKTIAPRVHPTERPLRLLFFGALQFDRPVFELADAIAISDADITLTFQGPNRLGQSAIDELVARDARGRIRVLPSCPVDKMADVVSSYDVGIVALRGADENERRASTTKLFTYMASGLAVLATDLPGIARFVHAYDNGLLVESMDPKSWARAIDSMVSLPRSLIDAMKQRSLDAARLYSWERQKPLFIAEFVRALGRGDGRNT